GRCMRRERGRDRTREPWHRSDRDRRDRRSDRNFSLNAEFSSNTEFFLTTGRGAGGHVPSGATRGSSCQSLGTTGTAAAGAMAARANAAGNPTAAMSPPKTGPTAAAKTNCPVFWIPSARPPQNGPAISATAVNANPFGAEVRIDATSRTPTAIAESVHAVTDSATIDTTTDIATMRIGPSRLPTRSDQAPVTTRPRAPRIWAA